MPKSLTYLFLMPLLLAGCLAVDPAETCETEDCSPPSSVAPPTLGEVDEEDERDDDETRPQEPSPSPSAFCPSDHRELIPTEGGASFSEDFNLRGKTRKFCVRVNSEFRGIKFLLMRRVPCLEFKSLMRITAPDGTVLQENWALHNIFADFKPNPALTKGAYLVELKTEDGIRTACDWHQLRSVLLL